MVTSTEGLRDILLAHPYDFEKTSAFRRYTRRFLASGLVIQEGDAHKLRRKTIGPIFQPRNVDSLKPLLCTKSQVLVRAFRQACEVNHLEGIQARSSRDVGSAVVDICDWATRFALDVACTVGFGEDLGLVGSRELHPILEAYITIFAGSKEKLRQYAWHNIAPSWLSKLLPHKLDEGMDKASHVIRNLTKKAVRKRTDLMNSGEKVPHDFLTEVIACGKFNAQECADELIILMAAA